MKDTNYTYAVSYIKTLENKMLSKNDIDALLSLQTAEEGLKFLLGKGYGVKDENNSDYNELLKKEYKKIWNEVINVCPKEEIFKILLYKNDFHNLKTILKAKISKVDWENIILEPCILDLKILSDSIKLADFNNLPDFIKEPAKEAYEILIKTNDAQIMEIFLDKVSLIKMREKSVEGKNEFLVGWADLNILIANMKTAARTVGRAKSFIEESMINTPSSNAKGLALASQKSEEAVINEIFRMGYPDGAGCLVDSFFGFEKWCDNLRIKYIKNAKNKSFGIEPIFAFLIAKELEIGMIRIIMSGKQNGVDEKAIEERLRDMYV